MHNVQEIIEQANRVREIYAFQKYDDLSILIVGPTYAACDAMRAQFPNGSGKVLAQSHIGLHFLDCEHPDDIPRTLRGKTGIRAITPVDFEIPNDIYRMLSRDLVISATALEVSIEGLITRVVL